MATPWVVRNSDNAWMVRGGGDPALIHSEPQNYRLVVVPDDACPDPRLTRCDETSSTKRRASSAAEIAAYDAQQPRIVPTRTILRRMTAKEIRGLDKLARDDDDVLKLWVLLRADPNTDVYSAEFLAGWEAIKARAVPSVWPDAATANARIAEIRQ